jgi:hypothetical protein
VWGLFDDRPEERAVLPGTVRFLSEETRVRGTGTHWLGQIQPGDVVRPAEGRAARSGEWPARVAAVVADDILELVDPWPNETITHTGGLQVGFQDGQDDWELVKATERVRRFLRGRGVEVEFGYVRNENPPTVPTPVRGFDGEPLASDLTGYAWDGDANQISTRWQRGIDGIVLYCGHGSPTRWLDPRFGKGDLGGVSGGPWYPIVLSICCHSGFFDSETDRVRVWNATTGVVDIVETTGTTGYGTHDVSFCEQVLREPGGGGIAAIGGSRGLDGGKNDRLVDGLLSAFYGDYFEGAILMGPGTRHAFEYLGDAVRAGKYTMHTWMLNPEPIGGAYSADDALYPLQAIHLFGDPMLKIRPSEGPADAK